MVAEKRCFGYGADVDDHASSEARRFTGAMHRMMELMGTSVIADAVPFLKWMDLGGYERAMKRNAAVMDCIIGGWLSEHRERRLGSGRGDGKQDFMDAMLSVMEKEGELFSMAAAENGVGGEGCGQRCWAWTQGRWRRRGRQETGKEGAGGSASAASRRKQRRRKRPRSMAATASWEAGTGRLMKTETKPMATEKSEGREDPHVIGGGKDEDEEGERDSGGGEVCLGSGNSITEEKGGGVCGDGREGRESDGRR